MLLAGPPPAYPHIGVLAWTLLVELRAEHRRRRKRRDADSSPLRDTRNLESMRPDEANALVLGRILTGISAFR